MTDKTTDEMNEETITLSVIFRALQEFRHEFKEFAQQVDNRLSTLEAESRETKERIISIEQQIETIKLELFDIKVRFDEMTSSVHETLMVVYKDRSRQMSLETRLNYLQEQIEILRSQHGENVRP